MSDALQYVLSIRPGAGLNRDQLRALAESYHLEPVLGEAELLKVWQRVRQETAPWAIVNMQNALEDRSGQDAVPLACAAGLGEGAERVLAHYEAEGKLLEMYAADALMLEQLKAVYEALDAALWDRGYKVLRWSFPDPDKEHMLYRQLLKETGAPVTISDGGMLMPLKSVLYQSLVIERGRTEDTGKPCHDLCSQCGRRDCPYREKTVSGAESSANRPEMPKERPAVCAGQGSETPEKHKVPGPGQSRIAPDERLLNLSYGYRQIFGSGSPEKAMSDQARTNRAAPLTGEQKLIP